MRLQKKPDLGYFTERSGTSIKRSRNNSRHEQSQDPVSWHIWQTVADSINTMLSYVFRGLKLLELAKNSDHKLTKLETKLSQLFDITEFDDDNCLSKILTYLQNLLKVDFNDPSTKDKLQIDCLKASILDQFQQFQNRTKRQLEKGEQQSQDQSMVTKGYSTVRHPSKDQLYSKVMDKSFTADLFDLVKQDAKFKFQEQISQPVKQQTQELTKTQIQFLYKINKISVTGSKNTVKDTQMIYRKDKLLQLEDMIYDKLEQSVVFSIQSAEKLQQLRGNQLKPQQQPMMISSMRDRNSSFNTSRKPTQSLHNFIQNKMFDKDKDKDKDKGEPVRVQLNKEFVLDVTKTNLKSKLSKFINEEKIAQQDQQITSDYLSNEKAHKLQQLQKYFNKYLQAKQKLRDHSALLAQQKSINANHYLNVKILKPKLKQSKVTFSKTTTKPQAIVETNPIYQPPNADVIETAREVSPSTRIIRVNSKSLHELLHKQCDKKLEYKDKIKLSKSNKVFLAVKQNNISIIQRSGFLYSQDDYNVRDDQGNTALYYSAQDSQYEMCRYLLNNGANPNIKCSLGQTATHKAYQSKNDNLIALFMEFGADLNVQDDNGIMPIDFQESEQFMTASKGKPNQKRVTFVRVKPQTSPKFQDFLEFEQNSPKKKQF